MSTKNTKAKTVEKSQTVDEVKTQKGGKKTASKKIEPVQEPVVAEAKTQKGGKKAVKQAEPVQETVVTEVKKQKGGKKAASKKTEPVQEPVAEVKAQKGGKKTTSKKAEPKVEVEIEAEAETKVNGEEGVEQNSKLRYFKLFYNDEFQGRYCGRKPKQAANKAFSSIIKEMKKNGNQKGGINVGVNFSIRECTRNSKHKEYNYVGVREELKDPVEVKIKNEDGSVKEITYSFHNKISKAPKVQA